jgi:hypothetical protein
MKQRIRIPNVLIAAGLSSHGARAIASVISRPLSSPPFIPKYSELPRNFLPSRKSQTMPTTASAGTAVESFPR